MDISVEKKLIAPNWLVFGKVVWLFLLLVAWWWTLAATEPNFRPVITFICILSLISGIEIFLNHGFGRITATGLFSLSTAMFVGLSGLLLLGESTPRAGWENLALACVSGLTAQVGTCILASRHAEYFSNEPFWTSDLVAMRFARVGILLLAFLSMFHIAVPSYRGYSSAAAFTAICFIAAGFLLRKEPKFLFLKGCLILGAAILYIEFFHSGTGRLHIVALACSIAFLVSARFPSRKIKVGIIVLIPFAILWMALDRLALEESLGASPDEGRTGLESMTAPLKIFSLLLSAYRDGGFEPGLGYNLLSVPALIIPESIWPSQPNALGYELVWFDDPARYGDGIFSTVATSTGEGIFNFGWLGILFVILLAAAVLRLFDSILASYLNYRRHTFSGLMGFILLAMLVGAVADYTWSGVHTYVARMLTRLPVFLVVLFWALIIDRVRGRNGSIRELKGEGAPRLEQSVL